MKLGLDTYSIHQALGCEDQALRKDVWWALAFAQDNHLDGLQFDPAHYPGDDEQVLSRLGKELQERGLYAEIGMGGWDPLKMRRRIDLTARFGGGALRTFFGWEGVPHDQLREWCGYALGPMQEIADHAQARKVPVAIENHGDFNIEIMLEFMKQVANPWVGICLDTGNALFQKEDPLETARAFLPYTRSVHFKDWTMTFDAEDKPVWKECLIGEGQIPIAEIAALLAAECPDVYAAMEMPSADRENPAEGIAREIEIISGSAPKARQLLGLT